MAQLVFEILIPPFLQVVVAHAASGPGQLSLRVDDVSEQNVSLFLPQLLARLNLFPWADGASEDWKPRLVARPHRCPFWCEWSICLPAFTRKACS